MVREVIFAVVAAVVALTVFLLGDRLRPDSWRHSGDETAGTLLFDLIKTFFAAVVAFVVVTCWQQYDSARTHTVAESTALVGVYNAVHGLPEPGRQHLEGLVREYTDQVIIDEWPTMNREQRLSPRTQTTLDTLRDSVQSLRSTDPVVAGQRSAALTAIAKVAEERQYRAVAVSHGIPRFLYVVLIFGTVLLLLSPVLSGVRVSRRSAVMIGLLGVVVGSALLQINNLDRPFSGGDMVSPDAYRVALDRFTPPDGMLVDRRSAAG